MAKVRVNWGPTEDDCPTKLFIVYNTAHNSLYVLARDDKTAMSVAYTANHVYSPTPKIADTYSRSVYEVRTADRDLPNHWGTIQKAIARRLEGSVHFEGDSVSIGYEVIE